SSPFCLDRALRAETPASPVPEGRNGTVRVPRLRVASTPWARMKGLLGTRALASDEGLWITPSNQVHTIGMRYPLDLVFLDAENRVMATECSVAPGRISGKVRTASSILELPAGAIERLGVVDGAQFDPGVDIATRSSLKGVGTAIANLSLAALYALFIAAH